MAKPISLSFKDTEQDIYDFVKSKSSPSGYIKDLLKMAMEQENGSSKKEVEQPKGKKSQSVSLSSIIGIGK